MGNLYQCLLKKSLLRSNNKWPREEPRPSEDWAEFSSPLMKTAIENLMHKSSTPVSMSVDATSPKKNVICFLIISIPIEMAVSTSTNSLSESEDNQTKADKRPSMLLSANLTLMDPGV